MKRIKSNRGLSFVILWEIYVAASVLGIVLYNIFPFDFWLSILLANVAATIFIFNFSLIFRNASVYDPYWSVQPIVILTALAGGNKLTAYGIVLMIAVWFWGLRLTSNWAYTFLGLDHQDWRYTHYEKTSGKLYPFINFTGIHMVPTLIVYLCTMPAANAIYYGVEGHPLSYVCCAFSMAAACMQGIADIQMHIYQKRKAAGNPTCGRFIRNGLWKYARHPNYLGEICMWWGIGLSYFAARPSQYFLLIGAIANTILFLVVSIPLADGKQSAKEGFEQYKNETHKLIPLAK